MQDVSADQRKLTSSTGSSDPSGGVGELLSKTWLPPSQPQEREASLPADIAGGSRCRWTILGSKAARLRDLLLANGLTDITVADDQPDMLRVGGLTADHIGTIAWQSHIPLYELTVQHASLEEAFMTLTQDSVEYRSTDHAAAVAA